MLKLECGLCRINHKTIIRDMDVVCSNVLDRQFAFTLSTFMLLHNGTFKGTTLLESVGDWFLGNAREMCFYENSDQFFRRCVYMHVRQCHWCTGKAYSPSHRFSSPETKLWPSDSESPPTTSQATEAGQEERGGRRVEWRKKRETEEERVKKKKDSDREGEIKDKEKDKEEK